MIKSFYSASSLRLSNLLIPTLTLVVEPWPLMRWWDVGRPTRTGRHTSQKLFS